MKNLILPLVLVSVVLVSCGPTPEELAALESLKSRETSLQIEVQNGQSGKEFWWDSFVQETDSYTKSLYADEYEMIVAKLDKDKAELAEVQFQISQIQ